MLGGAPPLEELAAQLAYALEAQAAQNVNRMPLHALGRVLASQQFDRGRYGAAVRLVKEGRHNDAWEQVQHARSAGHRYFDDCSALLSALNGAARAPECEPFKAELFFTAKLYKQLYGADSPWVGVQVLSLLGGPVGAGQGAFHRPVRRNRLAVFEVSAFDVANTIFGEGVTKNEGQQ